MPRRRVDAAALVFALLVLATVASFAWAQRLKRDPLVLDHVQYGTQASDSFTPNGDCRSDRIRISFRMTQSDDATVEIIKPRGRLVATLARDEFLKRYRYHSFVWDGRQRGGGTAPPGRYKLQVRLQDEDRTLVPPGTIRLRRGRADARSLCGTRRGGVGAESAP